LFNNKNPIFFAQKIQGRGRKSEKGGKRRRRRRR